MESLTVVELLKQVITSWQVIAVTIGIILYLNLVFFVTRGNRNPLKIHRMSAKNKPAKKENKPEVLEESGAGKSANEELGLEEK